MRMRKQHIAVAVAALALAGTSAIGPAGASAEPVGAGAAGGAFCQAPVDLTRSAPGQATVTRFAVENHEGGASAYDRVVIRLDQPVASVQVRYVKAIIGDGSGLPVSLRGNADLEVRLFDAVTHDDQGSTVPVRNHLRDWQSLRQARIISDFEGVVVAGIGVSTRVDFRVLTLTSPNRLVIDLAMPGQHPWTCTSGAVRVHFFNEPRYVANTEPFYTPVWRRVTPGAAVAGALSSLFNGPLVREHNAGLRFLDSQATGFTALSISNRIARVQLTGGCNAGGSTESIAGEIEPILKQFPGVSYVKIYDPWGHTDDPTGPSDSIPECLNP